MVSLLLLCLVATATVEAQLTGKQIDWSYCTQIKCYLFDSCWATPDKTDTLWKWDGLKAAMISNLNCPIGVQVKPFNQDTILILFQVLNVSRATDSLALYHADKLVVECKRNKTDGVISVLAGSKESTSISAELYENISYFDEKNALCAVVIYKSTMIASILSKKYSQETTRLRYTSEGYVETKLENKQLNIEMFNVDPVQVKCDPTLIQDGFPISGKHVLRVFDKGRLNQELDCTNYKKSLGTQFEYKLFVNARDKQDLEAPNITCNFDEGGNIWQYSEKEKLEYKQPFEAYCTVDVTKTCSEPACASPPCPLFTPGTESAPARLACPKDRWLIEGQFVEGQKAACENHELQQNAAAFYISTLSGARVELTNTSCFEKYNCKRHSHIDIAKCAPDTECEMATIDEPANRLTCPKGQLTVSHGGNETSETAEFACDYETGVWRGVGDNTTFIPPHSRITCYMEREEKKAALTDWQVLMCQIGGSLLGAALVAALGGCIGCGIMNKNKIKSKIAKPLTKMNPAERIAHAELVFEKAAHADLTNSIKIKDGLDLIETVVKSDVSEPQVWAAMDLFLDRLQGRLPYKSPNFGVMLARFCYLRAKQIIDKHGWKATKPITRSHPKGYFRMGAVKLLARSLSLHFHKDTQKLVVAGCLELLPDLFGEDKGPAAVYDFTRQQYPHLMGVMELAASLSLPCAPPPRLAQSATIEALLEIVRMPNCEEWPAREDQIPAHRSVQEQAAHALGTNARLYDVREIAAELMERDRPTWLGQAFFQGLADSPRHYFAQPFYTIFNCHKRGDTRQDRVDDFKALFTMDKRHRYLENLVRIFFCFDMEHDARYLLKIILHPEEPDRKLTVQHRMTQDKFEKAFTRDVHAIYDWLRERMDSEELKRRPLEMADVPKCVPDVPPNAPAVIKPPPMMATKKAAKKAPPPKSGSKSSSSRSLEVKGGGKGKPKPATSSEAEPAPARAAPSSSGDEDSDLARARTKASIERLQWLRKVWTDYAAGVEPPRKERARECLANPEEQAFLRDALYAIINKRVDGEENYDFTPRLVELICMHLVRVAKTEPVFIEDIPADSYICGDLHGNLYDLLRIFQATSANGKPGWECGYRFVFLGDYVDRGTHNLEVPMVLFLLKILYPDKIFLFRGNHEGIAVNTAFGFLQEMIDRYGKDTGMSLYLTVNWAFCYLSVLGIVGGEVLVAHGGISTDNFTPDYMRSLIKPQMGVELSFTVNEITWSDPACFLALYAVNKGRGNSMVYSPRALHIAFRLFDVKKLVRAHEVMPRGFRSYWNGDLWTVFSTSGQSGTNNNAAFFFIDDQIRVHATMIEFDGIHDVLDRKKTAERKRAADEEDAKKEGGKKEKKEEEEKDEEKEEEELEEQDLQPTQKADDDEDEPGMPGDGQGCNDDPTVRPC